ncbi:hypothetical protein QTN25_007545 [Entamoeba marina]
MSLLRTYFDSPFQSNNNSSMDLNEEISHIRKSVLSNYIHFDAVLDHTNPLRINFSVVIPKHLSKQSFKVSLVVVGQNDSIKDHSMFSLPVGETSSYFDVKKYGVYDVLLKEGNVVIHRKSIDLSNICINAEHIDNTVLVTLDHKSNNGDVITICNTSSPNYKKQSTDGGVLFKQTLLKGVVKFSIHLNEYVELTPGLYSCNYYASSPSQTTPCVARTLFIIYFPTHSKE